MLMLPAQILLVHLLALVTADTPAMASPVPMTTNVLRELITATLMLLVLTLLGHLLVLVIPDTAAMALLATIMTNAA